MNTPDSAPRWIEEPVSKNWITTQPDGTWAMSDPSGENRSRRFRRELFGDRSTEDQPDLRWIHDPDAPVTTPLGDLVSEKDFPLHVRKHRSLYDVVFVVLGARGAWIAEVRDERVAYWLARTVNDHWTDRKAQE